jgi:hypothetical protein
MKKTLLVFALSLCFGTVTTLSSFAQCAMCQAVIESNMSTGEHTIGSGINTGILYLLAMPYAAIALIAFFWYKNSKKYHAQLRYKSSLIRKVSSL